MAVKSDRRSLLLARPEGQLGNRLFLGATLVAHAAENGLRVFNPAFGEYARYFEGTRGGCVPTFPSPAGKAAGFSPKIRQLLAGGSDLAARLFEKIHLPIDGVRILDITHTHDREDRDYDLGSPEFALLCEGRGWLLLRGWKFRNHAALERQHPLVKEYFRPVSWVAEEARAAVLKARESADVVIGVHVRQGDYRSWLGGRYFFENGKYLEWMEQAVALEPTKRVAFVVCTNGKWTADCAGGSAVFRGPGNSVGDLMALAGCDRIMGPPSSFSRWASYYGRVPLHMLESADQQVHPATFTLHGRI